MASLQYLKEYTSYEFNFLLQPQNPSIRSISIAFQGQPALCKADLPSYLIDTQNSTRHLYILKWTINSNSSVYLDIFQYQDNIYQRIGFNIRPSLICIASGLIYVVGAQQVYAIEFKSLSIVNTFKLGNEELFAIEPAFLRTGQKQKSAILYSWNSKQGLKKKIFGRNFEESGNIFTYAKNLFKKADLSSYGNLKVLIPNVLGLLFREKEILIVNLTDMEIISHSSYKFEDNNNTSIIKASSMMIKYEQSKCEGFDESIIVGVADKESQFIYIFRINFQYEQEQKKMHYEMMGGQGQLPTISTFINGNGISWGRSEVRESMVIAGDGKIIDFFLNEAGVVYMCNHASRIPIANYIDFEFPEYQNPILPLQHNICHCYLKDYLMNVDFRQTASLNSNQQNLLNSVLVPNRYSIPFILAATGINDIRKIKHSLLQPKRLLLNWYKTYKPKSIIQFNGDIIIIRESSLSTLLPITKEQFVMEYQSGEELLRHFKESGSRERSDGASFFSKQSSKFQNFVVGEDCHWEQKLSNQQLKDQLLLGCERNLNKQNNEMQEMEEERQSTIFQTKFSQIFALATQSMNRYEQNSGDDENMTQIENKSMVFAQTLLQNRTKDLLNFYFRVLNRTVEGSTPCKQEMKRQQIMIHYLRYFSMVQNNSSMMIFQTGTDLISYLINKYVKIDFNQQYINIDREVQNIIGSLFLDIINPCDKVTINNMVKQLILLDKNQIKFATRALYHLFNPQKLHILPYTYSVLVGVCSLSLEYEIKKRFLNSFVLNQMKDNKSFNQNANNILQEFKEITRCLPNTEIREYKDLVQQTLMVLGGKNYQLTTNTLSSNRYSSTIKMDSLGLEGLDMGLDLDFWKLIRVSDSEDLENALKERDQPQIQTLKNAVFAFRNTNHIHSSITNDDILAAWVFLYRYYVYQLTLIIQSRTSQDKDKINRLASSAHHCLLNVSEYYQACYKPNVSPSQDYLITKVCGQMIGLSPLTLYSNLLANTEILQLIMNVSERDQIEIQVFSEFKNVVYARLSHCLQTMEGNEIENQLLVINKYLSKRQISEMILMSAKLRRLYDERLTNRTKSILGYTDINDLGSSNSVFLNQGVGFRNAYIESVLQK